MIFLCFRPSDLIAILAYLLWTTFVDVFLHWSLRFIALFAVLGFSSFLYCFCLSLFSSLLSLILFFVCFFDSFLYFALCFLPQLVLILIDQRLYQNVNYRETRTKTSIRYAKENNKEKRERRKDRERKVEGKI